MKMFHKDKDNAEEKFVRDLLETAHRRPPVPEEDIEEIRNAARTVWQQRYVDHGTPFRARRWMLPVAAALFGGLVLTWWRLSPRPALPPPVSAAHVDRVSGTATVSGADSGGMPFTVAPGQRLTVGSMIKTDEGPAESRVALRLTGRQSLRLDHGTRVRLVSPAIVELDRGAVYLDSLEGSSPAAVTIRTASGDFQPVGTQFEVRRAGTTHLRVREGRVRLQRQSGMVTAAQGEELIVHRDGTIERGYVEPDDPSWDWVVKTAPMLDIEGRTLRAFLDWVAREQGWKVKYATGEAASLSNTIILHGSISHLAPSEALRTVTLSSGFDYRVSDGKLIVGAAQGDRSAD